MGEHLGRNLRQVIIEAVQLGLISLAELDAHIERFSQAATPTAKEMEARAFMDTISRRTRERFGPPPATPRPGISSNN